MAKKDNMIMIPKEPEATPVSTTKAQPIKPIVTFEQWWAAKGIPSKYKIAVKKHFEARGFMASQEFDKGLKDFGL